MKYIYIYICSDNILIMLAKVKAISCLTHVRRTYTHALRCPRIRVYNWYIYTYRYTYIRVYRCTGLDKHFTLRSPAYMPYTV